MEFSELEKEVRSLIDTLGGNVGLYIKFLNDNRVIEHNPNKQIWAASVIKILISTTAYKLLNSNKLPEKTYPIQTGNRVDGSGISKLLDNKTVFTTRDLIVLTMTISDNSATNQLIDVVGRDEIDSQIDEIGLQNTEFKHKMMIKEGKGPNLTTASDISKLLEMLYKKDLPGSEDLLEIMNHANITDRIMAFIPNDVRVAHKTGSLQYALHDVGIVYSANPFIFCFLSDDQKDKEKTRKVLSECAKLCFDYSKPEEVKK